MLVHFVTFDFEVNFLHFYFGLSFEKANRDNMFNKIVFFCNCKRKNKVETFLTLESAAACGHVDCVNSLLFFISKRETGIVVQMYMRMSNQIESKKN